ncbi:MAG: sterol desaturase family protein [Proteobacteria bacterium]|nr:sterol desaturase family protein [Pseudomonadota bacterium]
MGLRAPAVDVGFEWWVWVGCFVVNDAMFYVSHRAGHEVRVLWAVHCVHHSPKHYDLTTGIRGSLFGVFTAFPFVAWIPLLGIHPLVFLIVDRVFKFYGLAYHTEAIGKLGWLDRWLITPSVHRVHHATNPQYLDRNYGGFFLGFDRLLGTWTPEEDEPVYGLTKDWNGTTVWDCQTHELRDLWRDVRSARSLGDAIRFALKPPGWRPEPEQQSVVATHDVG